MSEMRARRAAKAAGEPVPAPEGSSSNSGNSRGESSQPPRTPQLSVKDFPSPEPDGVTSWHELGPVKTELWGLSPVDHLAMGMVRGDPPTMRLYDAAGVILGLTEGASSGLLADEAGRSTLAGELPAERIPLHENTYLAKVSSLKHLPYSGVTMVLITEGMETTVRAAAWATRWQVMQKYNTGIPVVGYVGTPDLLADVKWPKGCKLMVKDNKTAQVVGTEVWGHDIHVLRK